MNNYTSADITGIVNGNLTGFGGIVIQHLVTDSRKLVDPAHSLFFALKGQRDAHQYIPDLYAKGVRTFVLSVMPDVSRFPEAGFILVTDVLVALQELSAYHRKHFNIPVIGITGSNGKTIVKEWLYQLLKEDENIVRSPKSYNSQIGVPLSVWQMDESNTLAIFEAGISTVNEMDKLEKIIRPGIGIFTNIGTAHNEGFKDLTEKTREKLQLFKNAEVIIYCKDYTRIADALSDSYQGLQQFTWSKKEEADLEIKSVEKQVGVSIIKAVYKEQPISISIPFTDEASVENAITCWAALLYKGYNNGLIAERMSHLMPVAMRLELKNGINNCSVINDSYNSDLASLTIALDFLNQQQQHPARVLILSDILQSGLEDEQLYSNIAGLVKQKKVDKIIGIGKTISQYSGLFTIEKAFYESTEDFLHHYKAGMFVNETILLKGARVFGFERINKLLQQKSHQTVLEINLNAIVNNYNYYRSALKKDCKIMVMVKAFSYGSGSFEIANILQFHQADYLAVAYADEGVELRKAGISLPIMVMNPDDESFDAIIAYNLEPEVYSFKVLSEFLKVAVRKNSAEPYPIHIKLDTGMHRLGFEEADIEELINIVKNEKAIKVQSVFSHLAGSDENRHNDFTRHQIELFSAMSDKIIQKLNYTVLKHILNSAGITRFPQAQFDMVRLGIGLYGISADSAEQQHLTNVGALKTTISQIKKVAKGETIGYSRKGFADKDMQIATVAIGYADGLSRKLSNGKGRMFVNDKEALIIGNVCMDMCMLDITGIDAKEGDEVVVFHDSSSITGLANDMETIPYEVLTNVSQRVKRVYYQE